jgi:protein-disulfide isomerase
MKRSLPFIIIVVVLIGAVAAVYFLTRPASPDSNANTTFVQPSPSGGAPAPGQLGQTAIPSSTPSSTPNTAGLTKPNVKVNEPVVLEEYGDYQCPPCGALYPELKKIESEYGKQVHFVYRFFPLTQLHRNALPAARAAAAAGLQNKFEQMHDLLYRNQKAWVEQEDPGPVFVSYARELGLNTTQFVADMSGNRVEQLLIADVQRGQKLGINGTPTLLVDGQQLKVEATNPDGIRRALNVTLEQKAVK